MLKKTITYTDYNGNERTEDFYFNLTKAEATEMAVTDRWSNMEKIVADENNEEILKEFKKFILDSYGEKSEDGRRFIKSDELKEAFSQTEAYSELFMELATNADAASDFMRGVVPESVRDAADAADNKEDA